MVQSACMPKTDVRISLDVPPALAARIDEARTKVGLDKRAWIIQAIHRALGLDPLTGEPVDKQDG